MTTTNYCLIHWRNHLGEHTREKKRANCLSRIQIEGKFVDIISSFLLRNQVYFGRWWAVISASRATAIWTERWPIWLAGGQQLGIPQSKKDYWSRYIQWKFSFFFFLFIFSSSRIVIVVELLSCWADNLTLPWLVRRYLVLHWTYNFVCVAYFYEL